MVHRIVWKIVLDFLILGCTALPCLLLVLFGKPYERGFFENDLSIRLPYREETIPEAILTPVAFAIIILTIVIVEVVRDRRGKSVGQKFIAGISIPGWLWETYNTAGIFCFGAALQQLTSDSTKYVVGRFRPHFFDVCRPVYNLTSPLNTLNYIQDFECTAATEFQLKNIRLSFPSAHASFGLYAAVFISCYLQVKCRRHGSKLLRHVVQFLAFLSAWYVGLTRVVENYHHWSDIAFGYLVGAIYGCLTFVYILKPKKQVFPTAWELRPPQTILPRPVLSR